MFRYGNIQFRIATTEDLIRATQRLRYRVYVQEYGWEKPEDHPDGIETDMFDPHSIHAAAIDENGVLVGTARMVMNSPLGLPIFQTIDCFDGFKPQSPGVVEFSRLCVDPAFRRSVTDVNEHRGPSGSYRFPGTQLNTTPSQDARKLSIITHGLIFILHQVGIRLRVTHWLMVSEKKLWVFLRRRGILFRQAGKPVQYHGERIPYIARPDEISHGLAKLHLETVETWGRELRFENHERVECRAAA